MMGFYKNLAIEMGYGPQDFDFDERNYDDGAWWAEQDAELMEKERTLAAKAKEVQDERDANRNLGEA